MPETHNPLASIKRKTARQWHMYWVYFDPAFISKFQVFKTLTIEELGLGYDRSNKEKVQEADDMLDELIQIFNLTLEDINMFLRDTYINIDFNNTVKSFEYNEDKDTFIVHFDAATTYQDYMNSWWVLNNLIQAYVPSSSRSTTRVTVAQDTRLLYAVFKARHGLTFKQVYELYRTGELLGYEGGVTNQFSDYLSLERYYNRNKSKFLVQSINTKS